MIPLIAALVTSLVAVAIAVMNGIQAAGRQEEQLKHDSAERTRQLNHDANRSERHFLQNLQQEIYLEAIAAVGTIQEYFGVLSDSGVQDSEISKTIKGINSSLNKTLVVGGPDTVRSFTKLRENLAVESLEFVPLRAGYLTLKRQREEEERLKNTILAKKMQLLHEAHIKLDLQDASWNKDWPKVEALISDEKKAEVRIESIEKQIRDCMIALIRRATVAQLIINADLAEVIKVVRKELALDVDQNLEAMLRSTQERIAQKLESTLKGFTQEESESVE